MCMHAIFTVGIFSNLTKVRAQIKATEKSTPIRLVSVGGALTEIIYSLNAGQHLVGVDTTSVYPEAATKLPSVGYARSLSAEGILALRPTQVVVTEDAGPPMVLKNILDSNIPLMMLSSNYRFEGIIERVQKISMLIGAEIAARKMISELTLKWSATQKQVSEGGAKHAKVLFILSHNPAQVMVAGSKTSADAMIGYAGGVNAISTFSGYKPLTPEAVIAANPDIILMTNQGLNAAGGVQGVLKYPGIEQTVAGRNKKIIAMETMYMLGFGPRMPIAVAELNEKITFAIAL